MTRTRSTIFCGLAACLAACGGGTKAPQQRHSDGSLPGPRAPKKPVFPTVSALQKDLAAMTPLQAGAPSDAQTRLSQAIDAHFLNQGTQRHYLHLDKPLYRPGEAIWFRSWELSSPTLTSGKNQSGVTAELISPKGATVLQKRIPVESTLVANDFVLPEGVQGGEYTLRVTSDLGGTTERKLIVSQYEAPRLKKKAEFLRKAYGPGDQVAAAVALHRATGEALAHKAITAQVVVDSAEVGRFPVTTDDEGNVVVKFQLPAHIARGDGLLTLLVEDGGVTESLQKRIPITLDKVSFEMFPEGGNLVAGLPGRVYFMAKNSLGKPADVEGRVFAEDGSEVGRFRSFHNGMGRFEIEPEAGARYTVAIDKPAGIKDRFEVPAAEKTGCTMQALDDYTSTAAEVRFGVWCSEARSVIASAVLREKRLGDLSLDLPADKPSVLSFAVPPGSQGAVRVTLFDEALQPLAERLVYRGRGRDLQLSVTSDKKSYAPRDRVELTVEARDLAGKPVEADLSMAVVDDTVLSFADDKSAHLLARLYLESEMPGQEIEEPNFYFSDEPKAAASIDLVLGTQGWRRFVWEPVLNPAPVVATGAAASNPVLGGADQPQRAERRPPRDLKPMAAPPPAGLVPAAAKAALGQPMPEPAEGEARAMEAPRKQADAFFGDEEDRGDFGGEMLDGRQLAKEKRDEDWAGNLDKNLAEEQQAWAWAPRREFPAPTYHAGYDGPRNDFRETIFWAPSVQTDKSGQAKVSFSLSDAITSFRVTAEGASRGGVVGRVEELVQSKLPVSLSVKMPLEVSKGDRIELPVTVSNETERAYDVAIDSQFGPAFKVKGGVPSRVHLSGGERKSFFAELEVVGDGKRLEDGLMKVAIDAANLKDEMEKTVRVVPLGFPQEVSISGTAENGARQVHDISLAGALPGSIEARVTMYPSPLATMISGTEAIIREPYGCFEQASSANYPNIMVLDYLSQNDAAEPVLVEKTMGHLDKGYKMLTGYESPQKGYEWFGGDPGHEALTAYGLMEFIDMSKVYGDVDTSMIQRTSSWLKSRRDGKGGYKRNERALDSFGAASPEVTNAYITYALSEAKQDDLEQELAAQKKVAAESSDPYVMALVANTLVNLEPTAAGTQAALKKLAGMQDKSGAFKGADHSITRSGGQALELETTSLAMLALLKGGNAYMTQVRSAIDWMNENRSGYGGFGSTQSTVLSLKAMSAYAQASRVTQSDGQATIFVNGKSAGTLRFEKGQRDPLVFDDIAASLRPGKNTIEVKLDSKTSLPYSIAIEYRSKQPASSPESAVALSTELAKDKVPMGEGVKMKVSVKNRTDKGQPMTLARVGLPGGLTFQTWQLKELMDKKVIDFYETREREVVLYFRSLAPGAQKDVDLDLMATVPGSYVAPASRAYLYYTDEYKDWQPPTTVTVTR